MTAAACLAVSAVSAVFIVILVVILVVIFFAQIIPPIDRMPYTTPLKGGSSTGFGSDVLLYCSNALSVT